MLHQWITRAIGKARGACAAGGAVPQHRGGQPGGGAWPGTGWRTFTLAAAGVTALTATMLGATPAGAVSGPRAQGVSSSPAAVGHLGRGVPSPGLTKARWQKAMAHLPTPGRGCYHASYPILHWHASQCGVAPKVPMKPAPVRGSARPVIPMAVGNNNGDYSAQVAGTISEATGSFGNVSPGITETGQVYGQGSQVANTFTLQLNTSPFSTPKCTGSCEGWQQFIYDTHTNTVFMQYWLLNYGTSKCPSNWWAYGSDCYTNSPDSELCNGTGTSCTALTAADLATANLAGSTSSGGNDEVSLSDGSSGEAAAVTNPDSMLGLAPKWNVAEFGVFGDADGGEANFGAKTTLEAQTSLDTNSTSPPTCLNESFTGETNNLNQTGTPAIGPQETPTIVSEQTNGNGTPMSCASTSGDFANSSADHRRVGDFTGNGQSQVLFYSPGDEAWWLGTFNGNTLSWTLADDSSGFGNTASDPTWTGDYTGNGKSDVLFYSPSDQHWWLGTLKRPGFHARLVLCERPGLTVTG